jgi:hypothetical protein
VNLDRLGIILRHRVPWEGIDLGFLLARRWFRPLWQLWMLVAFPMGMLFFFLAEGNLMLMGFLLWWFKPLYEPPLLFWLSRAVFDEQLSRREVTRQWWRIVSPQLFANLTWRRLTPSRSFIMPVTVLEGLKGKERKKRIAVLTRGQQAGAWLTVVGIHFETILQATLMLLIFFMIPEELRWIDLEGLVLSPGRLEEWMQTMIGLLGMSIIAPFYVAGGFALYLHRRSELEAWDLEIAFRKMAARPRTKSLSKTAASVLLLLSMGLTGALLPEQINAAELQPGSAKETITEVLAEPEFGKMKQESYWKYIGQEDEPEDWDFPDWLEILIDIIAGFFKGFASIGEIILWGVVILVVVYAIYKIAGNRNWMLGRSRFGKRGANKQVTMPQFFGEDFDPEELPEDIAAEAEQLARKGELRKALSLLYRGTLFRLIQNYHLEIPDSATEGECVHLVRASSLTEEADYFYELTRQWLQTAYAHTIPESERLVGLCQQWQEVYGRVTD